MVEGKSVSVNQDWARQSEGGGSETEYFDRRSRLTTYTLPGEREEGPRNASPGRVAVCEPNPAQSVKPHVLKMTAVRERRVNAFYVQSLQKKWNERTKLNK